jgi:hypothetical protein
LVLHHFITGYALTLLNAYCTIKRQLAGVTLSITVVLKFSAHFKRLNRSRVIINKENSTVRKSQSFNFI